MSRRTKGILIGAATLVLGLAIALPVFAVTTGNDGCDTDRWGSDRWGSDRWGAENENCGFGGGLMMTDGVRGVDAAAEALGMDVDDLIAAREDGQSLADIAESKGISTDALIDAMLTARETALNEAVADGRITQDQADYMLEHMSDEIAEHVDDTDTGPRTDTRGFGGMGMRGYGEGTCF